MAYKELLHPELGRVRISMRRNASRITARWADGRLLVIVPEWVSGETVYNALESMRPRLMARRPGVSFEPGRPLVLDGGVIFNFERFPSLGDGIDIARAKGGALVRIGDGVDMSAPDTPGRISRLLIHGARLYADDVILPQAMEAADRLGLSPRSIRISRGHKVLGHCSGKGDIAISAICMFLPRELREYIICHELAHLTEMNHSPRFHLLCDRYLEGREAELAGKLDAYV